MMLCSPSNLAVYTFQQKSSLINHNATVSLYIFPSKSLQLADILQHNNRAICRHRRVPTHSTRCQQEEPEAH